MMTRLLSAIGRPPVRVRLLWRDGEVAGFLLYRRDKWLGYVSLGGENVAYNVARGDLIIEHGGNSEPLSFPIYYAQP